MSRRSFVSGVAAAAVAGGVVGAAGGYLLGRYPSSNPITGPSTVSTNTNPNLGKTLVVGSAFPETGLFASDGLSGIKSATMAFEDWVNIFGSLPNGRPNFQTTNIDVPDKTTAQASAAITQLVTVKNVDFIMTDYITVDATEYDTAAQYEVYYINHDITGLQEERVLLNSTWAGTYPALSDIKWKAFNSGTDKVPATYPTHKYWNIFMGVIHDTDYSKNLFMLVNSWVNTGRWPKIPNYTGSTPINKKFAVFESAGSYGSRIGHAFEVMMGYAGWKQSFKQLVPVGTVEYGTILSQLKADPPALIFNTDFAPSDHAAFLKEFQADPLPSLIFHQYGSAMPDFIRLAQGNALGTLWHECRGVLHNPTGYDYEAHYWARWNEQPALADSAQSQDFAWNSLIVGGIAGGWQTDQARRMCAILNSGVDYQHSDYRTIGLGGSWSMRPAQSMRVWPFEFPNVDDPMGGPVVTYQVKARAGQRPPADGAATIAHPASQPGNVPTHVLIGNEKANKWFFDPDVIAITGLQETQTPYWSPLAQAIMQSDPHAFYISGQFAWSTDGVTPTWADETIEMPDYFNRVSASTLANITQ